MHLRNFPRYFDRTIRRRRCPRSDQIFKNANCPARRLTMAAAILSFGVIGIIQPSVDETLANSSQNVNLVYSIFIA